jgi:two-component system CheB/CheR fusion protein
MSDRLKKIKELTESLSRVESNLTTENKIFDSLLNTTLDGYFDWNLITNYAYLSPAWKMQLGYTDGELENSPRTWMALVNRADIADALAQFNNHVNSRGKIPFDVLTRYPHKAGHEVTILCRGSVVEWDGDKPTRMIGVHIDITNLIETNAFNKKDI